MSPAAHTHELPARETTRARPSNHVLAGPGRQETSPTERASHAPPVSWRSRLLLLMLAWAVPGAISVGQHYVVWASYGDGVFFLGGFCAFFLPWQVWALATPLVVWLGRTLPLTRRRWWLHLPAHLTCNALIGTAYISLQYYGGRATGLEPFASIAPLDLIPPFAIKNTVVQMIIYWGVLAADRGLSYQRRYREAELHRAQLEARLVEAKLDALRSQLQPHFLFNTLNAITVLVRKKEHAAAIKMLSGVSELLRRSLSSLTQEWVPLRDELDFLGHYLDIQRVRFPDRLQVTLHAEPAALAARVPSLFLQPLVENAIEHGIGPRAEGGRIDLSVQARGGTRLHLEIRDDGVGLSPDAREGIGVGNLRRRLTQLYGSAATFTLAPAASGGTVVTVELPLEYADAAEPT